MDNIISVNFEFSRW